MMLEYCLLVDVPYALKTTFEFLTSKSWLTLCLKINPLEHPLLSVSHTFRYKLFAYKHLQV